MQIETLMKMITSISFLLCDLTSNLITIATAIVTILVAVYIYIKQKKESKVAFARLEAQMLELAKSDKGKDELTPDERAVIDEYRKYKTNPQTGKG